MSTDVTRGEAMRTILASLLVSATTLAQSTWTVDAQGGGQFTTISAAVAAAADGDTILVVPSATYSVALTMSKALAIIGLGAATVEGTLAVSGIAAGHTVTLRGLQSAFGLGTRFQLAVTNCAGTVHCESLTLNGYWVNPAVSAHPTLVVQNVAALTLHRCSMLGWPGIDAANSSIACSESQVNGIAGDPLSGAPAPGVAIRAINCRIAAMSSQLHGGVGDIRFQTNGGDAVTLAGSQLIASATSFTGGAVPYPPFSPGRSLLLDAASRLTHDPFCTFADGIVGAGTITTNSMCAIGGSFAAPGQPTVLSTSGTAGDGAIVLLSLPSVPFDLPPVGSVWFDVAAMVVLQYGMLPLPPLGVTVPISVPRGLPIALHTVVLDAAGLWLSPPLVSIVP